MGGFLGSILRYGVSIAFTKYFAEKFYLGTLAVNLLGSLMIGMLFAHFTKQNPTYTFLVAGFCGGFTTFSAFSLDGLKLIRQNLYLDFLAYSSVSLIGGLLFCFIGFYLFQKL